MVSVLILLWLNVPIISFINLNPRSESIVESIECSVVEMMGNEDNHVPIEIQVNCTVKGRKLSDQQLQKLERAIAGCPVKRIIAGNNRKDYIRTTLKYEEVEHTYRRDRDWDMRYTSTF